MKTLLKSIAAAALMLAFLVSSAVAVSAETYYVYDGFRYRDADWNDGTLYFCGTENDVAQVTVPNNVASKTVVGIDEYAFYNNSVLTSIDLSQAEHLNSIGVAAFRGCSNLEALTIPATVSYLSEYMLTDCTSLQSVTINNLPSIIPAEMCNHCSSLESFEVPESVTEIRRYAFGSCTSLSYVIVPASVQSIAQSAFYNCPNLTLGVWYDSYAYHYAAEKNIPYTLLDGVKLGDVDGNGIVNINDVTEIQRYLAELDVLEGISLYASDVNRDGVLDISDATAIQMYLAEYEIEYPIGEIITQ